MAGRATPATRFTVNSAAASIAPLLPALTAAPAFPSATSAHARTIDASRLARTAFAGCSSISMTSRASLIRRRSLGAPPAAVRAASITSRRPTNVTGTPSSATARTAPATIACGALSPPIASTATVMDRVI